MSISFLWFGGFPAVISLNKLPGSYSIYFSPLRTSKLHTLFCSMVFHKILYLSSCFVKILSLFMHFSPGLSEHLYDCHFESSVSITYWQNSLSKSYDCVSLGSISRHYIYLIPLFGTSLPDSSFSLALFVGIYISNKVGIFPLICELALCKRKLPTNQWGFYQCPFLRKNRQLQFLSTYSILSQRGQEAVVYTNLSHSLHFPPPGR